MEPGNTTETPPGAAGAGEARELQVPRVVALEAGAERSLASWQERILPFLLWLVGGATVFFLAATMLQLNSLQRTIQSPPELDLTPALASLDQAYSSSDRLLFAQWKTLANLERHALERRYHQANVLLMSRTWTRYLGFMTGMILALVGAAFILGKLREESTSLALKGGGVQADLATTSPGLALCVLGTVLMLATILTHNEIETRDANPLYTRVLMAPQQGEAAPAPLPLGEVRDPLTGETAADPLGPPPDRPPD
jgi:hypothetical protein